MKNCVVFDFDGVIINSHNVQIAALKKVYQVINRDEVPPYDEFFRHSGDSLENIFSYLRLPLSTIDIYKQVSRQNIASIQLHDGMIPLLADLNKRHISCALCTGKDRKRTLEILQYFSILTCFDCVVCSDDVKTPKPDPESLLYIMKTLLVNPEQTIMVGDGINDIECAHNANIKSIAVTWGDLSEDKLVKANPSILACSPKQLHLLILDNVVSAAYQ